MNTRVLFALAALLWSPAVRGGVMLIAEVYETPGLPGFQTFDLTASSPLGYINGLSFYGDDGVLGPVHGGSAPHASDSSRWLVSAEDGLQIGRRVSEDGMSLAYTFSGDHNDTHRNVPIARIVTSDPSAIRIAGEFDVRPYWNDGTFGEPILARVDTSLHEVPVGQAPVYDSLPDVPDDVLAERQAEADRLAARAAEREARLAADRAAREEFMRQLEAEQLARAEAQRLAQEQRAAELAAALERRESEGADPTAWPGISTTGIDQVIRINQLNRGVTDVGSLVQRVEENPEVTLSLPRLTIDLGQTLTSDRFVTTHYELDSVVTLATPTSLQLDAPGIDSTITNLLATRAIATPYVVTLDAVSGAANAAPEPTAFLLALSAASLAAGRRPTLTP